MVSESQVLGRDEDKETLVKLLLNHVSSQARENLFVCPILGIGGLGKTTLAQLVYNDVRVAEHFELKSWVCVSDDFDVRHLLKAIIVSISGDSCQLQELDLLQDRLQQVLDEKRFLVVLDDVWSDSLYVWGTLKRLFQCGAEGSSVVVTTRFNRVASVTGTLPAWRLTPLSEDDCWSLFKQRAFDLGNEEKLGLVEIGRQIVKKCGGVPLAAKVLGGLMHFKSLVSEWLYVRDKLPGEDLLLALTLSYDHLPSHMQQCFSYCSIFPKDMEIRKEELILLWMANGLVQPQGQIELEDVGDEIFNTLVLRSFFEEILRDEDGNITVCNMHDLVHDLACQVALGERPTKDNMELRTLTERTRHLAMLSSTQEQSSMLEYISESLPDLSSLIRLNFPIFIKNLEFIFSSFTCLLALDLSGLSIIELPHSINKLKHLRYLNLSHSCMTSLPESICELITLQTLRLRHCHQLKMLPENMQKLSSLRHLDILECRRLTRMPIGIGKLVCLQTLSFFIVGLESGRGIKELEGLDLRGEIEIKGLEHVNSMAGRQYLSRKKSLSMLKLSWSGSQLQKNDYDVIEALQPHSNLRRLIIEGYQGFSFPNWLAAPSLPKLVNICLKNCRRCEHLPPLGKLPLLKVLKIHGMDSVKVFIAAGFPSLEELELSLMTTLKEWSSCYGGEKVVMPSLKRLNVWGCPKLTKFPLLLSLEDLTMKECDKMLLRSLQNLPRLSSLVISEFDEKFFPEGMLGNSTSLRKLSIAQCARLEKLPEEFRNLSSLKELIISDCPCLKYLPKLMMSSLEHLFIGYCESLTTPGRLQHLSPALRTLTIRKCPLFEVAMVDFQHLVSLRHLSLI